MNDQTWDESLLRAVAVLQTQCRLLDEQADILTDLSDMQAHRRIKSDLADYIAAHAKSGNLPHDPIREINHRLSKLSKFFCECSDLQQNISQKYYRRFVLENTQALPLNEIVQAQVQLEEIINQLPADLHALASQLSALDWRSIGDVNSDIHSELLDCAQGLGVKLPDEQERMKSRSVAMGQGQDYEKLQRLLEEVRKSLPQLIKLHSRHRKTLGQAADQITLGNHCVAGKLVDSAGLAGKIEGRFSDIDYSPLKELQKIQTTSASAICAASSAEQSCRSILTTLDKSVGTIKQRQGIATARQKLAALRSRLAEHIQKIAALPGSELEQECKPHLEAALTWPDWAEGELDAKAKKNTQKLLLMGAGIMALAMLLIIGIAAGISSNARHEKQVAAENAEAARKALLDVQDDLAQDEAEIGYNNQKCMAARKQLEDMSNRYWSLEEEKTLVAARDEAEKNLFASREKADVLKEMVEKLKAIILKAELPANREAVVREMDERAAAYKTAAEKVAVDKVADKAAAEKAAAEKADAELAAKAKLAADLKDAETACASCYQGYLYYKTNYDLSLASPSEYYPETRKYWADETAKAYQSYQQEFEKVKLLRADIAQTQPTNK